MTRQSPSRYTSMDGFIPSGQARHVGFGGQAPRPINGGRRPNLHPGPAGSKVPVRRPGLHSAPDRSTRSTIGANASANSSAKSANQAARHNFPEFTTYTSPNAPAARTSPGKQRDNAGGAAKSAGRSRHTNWKKVFKRTAAVVGIFVLLGGGYLGWQFLKNTGKVFGGDASVLGFLNASKLRGEDKGKVNIMLAGVSTDDPGHDGAALTDSIIIMSLDTTNKKAFMLSIPRDMWVKIPGYGHAKINAANAYGDADKFSEQGYPAGGIGLLAKVINDNFEIPINYYAKINYSAFRDTVNAVGGIDVNIQSSDKRGLYDPNISKADHGPLRLANGPQHLDGQTALNLARARGDPTGDGRVAYGFERSDFTRTEHQRQMMLALKERVSSSAVITNPLKIGQLFDAVGKNVTTDFQPSEIRRLYDLSKQIKTEDITSISLNDVNGTNMLASYRTADGASALIPAAGIDNFSAIQLMIKKLTSSDPVVKESAKIVILNGADVTGLASKESNKLTSKGLNVVAVGDAPNQQGGDIIIDVSAKNGGAKPGTLARLKQYYGQTVRTENPYGYPSADFIVVLGTNHASSTGNDNE